MSDPFIERLFAGIPGEIAKLRPLIAEIEAFNARNAAADERTPSGERLSVDEQLT